MEPGQKIPPIVSMPLTWSSAIGLFMLNFGTLEMLVFTYIEKCLPDEFEKWREKPLKERAEHVGEHIATTPDRRAAYQAFLQHLTPVRELRNLLAHGYLQLVIRPGSDEVIMGITQAKDLSEPFRPGTKHLSFPELGEALSALDGVVTEFQKLTDKETGWKT